MTPKEAAEEYIDASRARDEAVTRLRRAEIRLAEALRYRRESRVAIATEKATVIVTGCGYGKADIDIISNV